MPIIAISGAPSREEYEAVSGNIDLDHRPAGWLVHAATQAPTARSRSSTSSTPRGPWTPSAHSWFSRPFDKAGVDARDRRPPAAHETFAYHGPAPVRA